jgi:hypothetical protein
LFMALRHFLEQHPDARTARSPTDRPC